MLCHSTTPFSSHSTLTLLFLSVPPTTTALPLLSSLSSIQTEQEMECVEGALKTRFGPEMAAKTTQQPFLDNFSTVNGQSGVSGDDSFVDDLLDFSKGGVEDGFVEEDHEQDNKACCVSVSPKELHQQAQTENDSDPSRGSVSVKDDFQTELSVPADDLEDLEWLSHFVEDSFFEYSLTFPVGKLSENPTENWSEPEIPVLTKPCFTTPVQTKARSKRARTGGRVWSLESPSLTSSSSSSSSSSSTSSPLPSNPWLIYTSPSQTAESFPGKPSLKKQKKNPTAILSGGGAGAQQPRRCSHCLVQKTPQWRTGPHGAKTLCNACGVRYKSGRLLPEYRPACSPTFSSDIHSNHHRKVLEMRRKKEVTAGPTQTVHSF
ncbi:hypothetical protein F0562_006341 [Nyssa sinensis]|uniref:GATA-type domain-containing protein n=1 Tax=Nyssa sinensis TaxID=561372 RepID=A0A5J5AQA8_9ASTE|nr:hypothetical protein F0562_006341 [Nyssa sinensis]